MSAARSSQLREPRATAKIAYPTIRSTTSPTTLPRMIGPQLRLPATVTGVMGLRPLFLPPPPFAAPAFAAPAFAAPGFVALLLAAPAGGLPWPDVLPTLTVDGTRSGPGVLMLIVPRQ